MGDLSAWKPSSGGRILVPGTSPQKNTGTRAKSPEQKLTTYERTSAAVKQYWDDKARGTIGAVKPGTSAGTRYGGFSTMAAPLADTLPGGEKDLAARVRESCWHDNVYLKQQEERVVPTWEGTPLDLEEKERIRTRGIPGYTGVQPALEVSRPPPPAEEQEDISRLTSINGLDAPRPRVKGIPGYTGHQPPAPDKRPAPPPPRLTLQQRFGNRPHPSIAAGQAAYDSYHQQAAQQQQAAAAAAGRQAGEGAAVQEEGEEQEVGGVPPRFYDNGVERVPAQTPGPWHQQATSAAAAAAGGPPAAADTLQRPASAYAGSNASGACTPSSPCTRGGAQQQQRPGSSRPTMYAAAYGAEAWGSRGSTASSGRAGAVSPFARAQTAGTQGAAGGPKPTYVMAKYAAYGGVRNGFDSMRL